jgi:hypothetical protein
VNERSFKAARGRRVASLFFAPAQPYSPVPRARSKDIPLEVEAVAIHGIWLIMVSSLQDFFQLFKHGVFKIFEHT